MDDNKSQDENECEDGTKYYSGTQKLDSQLRYKSYAKYYQKTALAGVQIASSD